MYYLVFNLCFYINNLEIINIWGESICVVFVMINRKLSNYLKDLYRFSYMNLLEF